MPLVNTLATAATRSAPSSSRARTPGQGQWLTVESRTPDRIRLNIRGLYRNPALRRRLEDDLRSLPGLRMLRANEISGRLLLLLKPGADHDRILALIEKNLATHGVPARRIAVHSATPTPTMRSAVQPSLQNAPPPRAWHALTTREVMTALQSHRTGLSEEEADRRLGLFGANRLPTPSARSPWSIFLGQFQNLPVALLGASAAVSLLTGGFADAVAIAAVLVANGVIGYRTESQTERVIHSLAEAPPAHSRVYREGRLQEISQHTLAPGDIVQLAPGDQVPADARLLRASRLHVDESALTGESIPARKRAAIRVEAAVPLGDRVNMVHMGTTVTGGSGVAVVVGTGLRTAIGEIHRLVGEMRAPQTPLQRQLDRIGARLAVASVIASVGLFGLGLLRGHGPLTMLKASVSLAVAALPEGLGTVATTTLAGGIRRLRQEAVAVRRLHAVETLGAVQALCLDKTGTLTENRMSVVAVQAAGELMLDLEKGSAESNDTPTLRRLWEVAALCNDSGLQVAGNGAESGSGGTATENALIRAAEAAGVDTAALRSKAPRDATWARSDTRPYMATSHRWGREGNKLIAVKGSPLNVLELCKWQLVNGRRQPLSDRARRRIEQANERMAADTLRVLGLAYTESSESSPQLQELTWLGLVGMADPIRKGVPKLIQHFHRAGVRTIMITGDQTATARAIGRRLNLANGTELKVLDAAALAELDPAELSEQVKDVHVFARVSPADKLQIVRALQQTGLVVAMTGDGVNDSPALRAADIGIAMGRGGTDAARAVADVVLEQDNLSAMLTAVEQGRIIHRNIRKSMRYLISTNCSELLVMVGGIAFGSGVPLTPLQLLWLNLASDVFPALALALEPPAPDVLRQPPSDAHRPIIHRDDWPQLAREAGLLSAATLSAYAYGHARHRSPASAANIAFHTLAAGQLLHAFTARSQHHSIFNSGSRPPNRSLRLAVAGPLVLQLFGALFPPLRALLGQPRLGLLDLMVIGAGAIGPLLINELGKAALEPDR